MFHDILKCGLLAIPLLLTGCMQIRNAMDECLLELHDTWDAKMAWVRVAPGWSSEPYIRDYKYGFQYGYFDALRGKGECPPPLPPRRYWSACHMGPDSSARIARWYNGYADGATQAMADNVANRYQIPVASMIYNQSPAPLDWPEHLATEVEDVPPVPGEGEDEFVPDEQQPLPEGPEVPPLPEKEPSYFPRTNQPAGSRFRSATPPEHRDFSPQARGPQERPVSLLLPDPFSD
jgi:hypothetical protein